MHVIFNARTKIMLEDIPRCQDLHGKHPTKGLALWACKYNDEETLTLLPSFVHIVDYDKAR